MLPFHFIAAAGSAAAEEIVTVALHHRNAAADETVTVALHHRSRRGVGVGAGLTGDALDADGGVADVEGWAWAAAAVEHGGRRHADDEQRLSAGDADA